MCAVMIFASIFLVCSSLCDAYDPTSTLIYAVEILVITKHARGPEETLTIAEETSEGNGPFVISAGPEVDGGSPLNEFVLDRLREPLLRFSFAESAEDEAEDACLDMGGTNSFKVCYRVPYALSRVWGSYYIFNY